MMANTFSAGNHLMNLTYACPNCQLPQRIDLVPGDQEIACGHCDWMRGISSKDWIEQTPSRCLACGCHDLWRQKDFPQWLGMLMVGSGAVLSTIAWGYMMPMTALGILMGFALMDLLLYALMPDVLVCYRCESRHRQTGDPEQHPKFNLEVMERYRQEALRQKAPKS
jgi:hypothetical protein